MTNPTMLGKASTSITNTDYCDLDLAGFARLFGTTPEYISPECVKLISQSDFRYSTVSGNTRDQIIVDILKRVDAGQFTQAGKEGKARWEAGWGENYKNFVEHNYDLSQLFPKYIHAGKPLRLYQDYIQSVDPLFELNWYKVFQLWLFQTYLKDVEHIFEFGCGPCHNLVTLTQLYPDKNITGLDWAKASVDIANSLGKVYGWKVNGRSFDFFAPDKNIKVPQNSAVITIGGLEQTGANFGAFIQYLIEARPKLVIHVEPFLEWYDERNLVDYLAIRFHKHRKYLEGLLPWLEEAAGKGQVNILNRNRCYFGSLYHDGYSLLVWKPE